jgi:hypothetical protein
MRERNKSWKEFTRWCQAKGLSELPAHAWTVAAYVRFQERRKEHAELLQAMKEIARRHLLRGYADPSVDQMVENTLERVANRQRNRHNHSALFDDDPLSGNLPETAAPTTEDEPLPSPGRRKTMRSTPKLVRRRR